jgi:hypothetical protein
MQAVPRASGTFMTNSDPGHSFFEDLPAIADQAGTFDPANYTAAPESWLLAVADVEDSTGAIARGQYRAVNFVAASVIAALKNVCRPGLVPFLFGGDGAAILVPPDRREVARLSLARVRRFAAVEYGLRLRVGLAPVSLVRAAGTDVRVGRYEPAPGNSFGVFLGGGVARLEAALKGRVDPELAAAAAIPESLDDGEVPDLDGLSCRWDELRSGRGQMVSLIVSGARDPGGVHRLLHEIAARGGDPSPVRTDNLRPRWPPKGLMVEARARRGHWPAAFGAVRVLAESLVAALVLAWDRPLGTFDPKAYRQAIADHTDFSKCDDVLSLVLDCDAAAVAEIRRELDRRAAAGELRYGMHLSETALMTCLVTSLGKHEHVHFVDGGNGGYAMAARGLKGLTQGAPA